DLAEAADRSEPHRVAEFLVEREVVPAAPSLRPLGEHLGHLGGSGPAGYALAARLVAEEADRVERHVEHAGAVVAHDDRPRAERRARRRHRVPAEREEL